MDNPTTLLVAIMYVTIVASGLIAVLMALSDIVGGQRKTDLVHTGWIVLLVLVYMSFFWETTAILNIEGWKFLSFMGFISGPILLFFATNLITSPTVFNDGELIDRFYLQQSARFFLLLLLVQIWIVGMDTVFNNVNYVTWLTVITGGIFGFLMISRNYRVHIAGLAIVASIFLMRIVLQAL